MILKQTIWCLMMNSDSQSCSSLRVSSRVPRHTKINSVCWCFQHAARHTVSLYDKQWRDSKWALILKVNSPFASQLGILYGAEDVLMSFRLGGSVCGELAGQRGRLKNWVMSNSRGWWAGRCATIPATPSQPHHTPINQHLSPSPSLIHQHFKGSGALNSPHE